MKFAVRHIRDLSPMPTLAARSSLMPLGFSAKNLATAVNAAV